MFRDTLFQYILNSAPKLQFQELDYDKYWRTRSPMGIHSRFNIIAGWVESGASVLDIGCGRGELLCYLTGKKQIKGYGLDISKVAVKAAKISGIEARVADVLKWEPETIYDYVIMTEVLEHLTRPEEVMLKVKSCSRKGVIISIPNTGFYKDRLRLLFGHFPVQWVYHPSEHLRYWTVADLKVWLVELGFELKTLRASTGTRLLRQYWPALFGAQIVCFCQIQDHND